MIKSSGAVTTVKLIGSSEAQQKAKELIQNTVQLVTTVDLTDRGTESMCACKHEHELILFLS